VRGFAAACADGRPARGPSLGGCSCAARREIRCVQSRSVYQSFDSVRMTRDSDTGRLLGGRAAVQHEKAGDPPIAKHIVQCYGRKSPPARNFQATSK